MNRSTTLILGEGLLRIMHMLLFIATHSNNAEPGQVKKLEFLVDNWEARFSDAYALDFHHK